MRGLDFINHPASRFGMTAASLNSSAPIALLALTLSVACYSVTLSPLCLIFHQSLLDPDGVYNKVFRFFSRFLAFAFLVLFNAGCMYCLLACFSLASLPLLLPLCLACPSAI